MLGNDIVDLQLAATQSNWRRKGYLEKIFTQKEQNLISTATNQDQMVWLLWSMKESVYKIINRQTLERLYSPKTFECKIILFEDSKAEGSVKYNGITYFTKSDLSKNFIYTIGSAECLIFNKITTKYLPNSKNYTPLLKQEFGIHVQKNLFGVPEIIDFENEIKKPVSISHHGRFLAIVY